MLLLVLLLAGFSFLRVGSWLVVSEEPAASAAIVVLSGEVPFRAMRVPICTTRAGPRRYG